MLNIVNKYTEYYANSMIDNFEVLMFNSICHPDKEPEIYSNVKVPNLYEQHKEECDNDFEAFKNFVLSQEGGEKE